jgi:potassium efflux system protein
VDNRVEVVTDLHKAIDQKFRAAGITIAFPQIDVHLNTVEPLHVQAADASVLKPG